MRWTITFQSNFSATPEIMDPSEEGILRWWMSSALTIRRAIDDVRRNLSFDLPEFRHATRLCFAATLACVVVRSLKIPFLILATMATLFVLQPASGATSSGSRERAARRALGAALAAPLGLVVHSPVFLCLATFRLICLTIGLDI
jgi:uncharacterized membrane protein YccC